MLGLQRKRGTQEYDIDVGNVMEMWWECDDKRGRIRLCRLSNMYIYSSTHPV